MARAWDDGEEVESLVCWVGREMSSRAEKAEVEVVTVAGIVNAASSDESFRDKVVGVLFFSEIRCGRAKVRNPI